MNQVIHTTTAELELSDLELNSAAGGILGIPSQIDLKSVLAARATLYKRVKLNLEEFTPSIKVPTPRS